MLFVGAGSGIFNSPNPRTMMSIRPPDKRGVASGARTLVVNLRPVLSMAFALAIVTNTIPASTMVKIFSEVSRRLSEEAVALFLAGFHAALLFMAGVSLVGAVFSA